MQVSFPVETFNEALRNGSVGQKLQRILEEIKPEASYFCAVDGKRTGYFVIDMKETSEMPKFAEPFFLSFNAMVTFMPTMTPQDLQKSGLDKIPSMWR